MVNVTSRNPSMRTSHWKNRLIRVIWFRNQATLVTLYVFGSLKKFRIFWVICAWIGPYVRVLCMVLLTVETITVNFLLVTEGITKLGQIFNKRGERIYMTDRSFISREICWAFCSRGLHVGSVHDSLLRIHCHLQFKPLHHTVCLISDSLYGLFLLLRVTCANPQAF